MIHPQCHHLKNSSGFWVSQSKKVPGFQTDSNRWNLAEGKANRGMAALLGISIPAWTTGPGDWSTACTQPPVPSCQLPSIPAGISARLSPGARTSPQDFILKTSKQESKKKTPLTAKLTKNPRQLLRAGEAKQVVGLSLARSFFPGLNLQELGGNVFQWDSFVPLLRLYLEDDQHWPIPHQKGS